MPSQPFVTRLLEQMLWANSQSVCMQMPKHRKLVDRRASKGRRIRFNVMEKLVNFMEPVQAYEEADGRISSLYSNLFGQCKV